MSEHAAPDERSPLERLLGDTEPVRRALYPVVVAVVALLVAYGLLDAEAVPLWLALAAAVLGVGGVEAARSIAWAPRSVVQHADDGWSAAEQWRAYATERDRSPESVATETVALPRQRAQCREVVDGDRCELPLGHGGPHMHD